MNEQFSIPAAPDPAPSLSVPADSEMLAFVEAFLVRSGMAESRFGLEAMREGGLVKSLREGRSLSMKNGRKVVDFIREWDLRSATQAADESSGKASEVSGAPYRVAVCPVCDLAPDHPTARACTAAMCGLVRRMVA